MLRNILRWMRTTKSGADDKQFAVQQVEYLGKVGDGAMLFPYGYHGNLPPDFLVLGVSVQDNPDNRVAIGCLPKKRPKLKEGEVAFYHPPTDAFIIWRESGDLDIETGSGGGANINIKATTVNITADVNITGNTEFTGTVMANGKPIDETHSHTGSPTSPVGPISPTGVVV